MTEFRGWPPEAFDFYARLTLDNTRAFWQAHRATYDEAVKAPFALLSDLVEADHGPLHLFRPYRDVRFSRDKTPYKTAAGAVTEGEDGVAYYVQLDAEGLFVGSGMYHLAPDQLGRWRAAVDHARRGPEIESVVADLRKRRYEIGAMESLTTAPRGFPRDHPRIELLRLKGLTAGRRFALARWMHTRAAGTRVAETWAAAAGMHRWLGRHVGPSTLPPPEPD